MIARDMAAAVAPNREAPLGRYVRWALVVTAASMPLYVVRWRIGPLPTTVLENLILITVALYAIAVWRRAAHLPARTPYEVPIALFLVAGLIGVLVAPDHRGALGIFRAYLLEPIAMYYVATAVLGTAGAIEALIAGWGVGAVTFAIVEVATLLQAFMGGTLRVGHAAAALGINPNSVALYLEPPIAIAAAFVLFGRGRQRWLAAGVLSVLVAADVATLSRGGLLALAALIAIALVTVRAPVFRLALVAASLVGALVLWQLPFLRLRMTYLLRDPAHTLYGREHIWAATLRMLGDHPIFGAGINAYQTTMAPYRAADTYQVPEPYAHNIVLTTWSELGLLGLLAFIYLLITLIVQPWRALARAAGLYRPLLWGLGTGFAMVAVHGIVDSPYWKNDLSLEFWLLAALEVVALRAVGAATVAHD
jgi:putative inorganic carbon (HCO3(-)) transporter